MRAESNVTPGPIVAAGKTAGVPLIAHIIYRLDMGGLENGLVNLINRIPTERYRHAIICLTSYSEFYQRIQRSDVCLAESAGYGSRGCSRDDPSDHRPDARN